MGNIGLSSSSLAGDWLIESQLGRENELQDNRNFSTQILREEVLDKRNPYYDQLPGLCKVEGVELIPHLVKFADSWATNS